MSNTRDNTPEMDYYELRRQREEYKQRMRMEQNAKNRSAAVPAPEPMEEPRSAQPQPEFIEEQDVRPAERDAFEAAIEEGYENAEEADFDDADDLDGGENPNPFDSFIHFFHGVKSSISARRGREEDEMDDLDELPEDEAWDDAEAPQRPAPSRRPAEQAEPEYEADEAANAVDIQDDFSRRRPARVETDFQDEADSFIDDGFEDDLDEDMPRREGGFKKFMNLFVERVDEDDAQDEDAEFDDGFGDDFDAQADLEDPELDFEEDEGDAPRRRGLFGRIGRRERIDEVDDPDEEIEPVRQDARYFPILRDEPSRKPEGGHTMEENRKPTTEAVQTASAAEGVGMTRRERRELAMRLAAEEAARKAKEEAAQKAQEAEERRAEEERIAAEKPIAIEPLFSDMEPAAKKVDMAAFENAPETDILVETTAEEAPAVDEPTRKFKPVSLRDVQEAAKSDLFDVEDEDDEDDEDEIIEKKSRFSLFGRKKSSSYDDDEDEDDYEDDDEADEYEDDEDEDEDDADEIVEKKSRRGLFGRKKPSDDDDEDDEDDEYDDEDSDSDEDEDDEYDEYDDEDDDEYDEDEDEPRRSFGHHLLGIFKVILGVILVLLVIVIALNFFSASTVNKLHAVMGDSSAFQLLFPSYSIRASMPAEEDAGDDLLEDMLTPEPTALPEPEATVSIPNLDDTAAQGDTSIVTAPVVEAAPVTEGSIG